MNQDNGFSTFYFHQFVLPNKAWLNWTNVSRHPDITLDVVISNPGKEGTTWNPDFIAANPNISPTEYMKHFGPISSASSMFPVNPSVSLDEVGMLIDQLGLPRDMIESYIQNPGLNLEETMHAQPGLLTPYNVFFLNEGVTFRPETLLLFPDYHWDMRTISKSPCVTPEFVLQHMDWPWNASSLSANPNLVMEFVLDHPEIPWDRQELCANEHVVHHGTMDEYPDFHLDITGVSRNYHFTYSDVQALFPEITTCLSCFSGTESLLTNSRLRNDNLRFEEVTGMLSTFKGTLQYYMQYYGTMLSKKRFRKEREVFESTLYRHRHRCHLIEKELVESVFHPKRLCSFLSAYPIDDVLEYWTDMT